MAGWKIYTDSACTTVFTDPLALTHYVDLSDNPQDTVLYYANVDDDANDAGTIKKEAASNPGVDNIVLSVVDADTTAGHAADEVTLATTAADLGTNTAGASLSLGTTLYSGVSRAQPIHVRVVNAVTEVSVSTELSVQVVATTDSAV